jgi:tRNA-splicing ligase RtcB
MQVIDTSNVPIKAWVDGVAFEDAARRQVENVAGMPFVFHHVAVMPDVHFGMGATVGSVVATRGAVIPAAVGVDIGCGMVAVETSLSASQLPDSLTALRSSIERAVPVGGPGEVGSWKERGRHGVPAAIASSWRGMQDGWSRIVEKHPKVERGMTAEQLGTLGTGNHFIEVCLDERQNVWVMLHSGSRGLGNRVGTYFIEQAKAEMRRLHVNLPDLDLAYASEGSELFDDYLGAVGFAQEFARINRELMLARVLDALRSHTPPFQLAKSAVNCHHNYVSREHHFGADVLVTRKGAVRARAGELGIIPGSMGTQSYIVRGKGNAESFESCSHGAGRRMSRAQAKRTFSLEEHARAVAGVECRRDAGVLDETPGAYKPIDAVMEAQKDLVDVVHRLKQVLCVKG